MSAPAELARRPQWVAWRLVPREGEPKPTKVPYDARTGRLASTTDPTTWASFEEVAAFVARNDWASGVGYVLSQEDPYVGIDLDACRNKETGKVEEWARDIVKRLESYTEVSPSGTGLRIFVRGELPSHGRRKGHIEMYSQARFLTITGQALSGLPVTIQDRREELLEWHAEVFGQAPEQRQPSQNGHSALPVSIGDVEIIARARNAKNGAKFWALWNGDWSGYDSQSNADLALVDCIAFWTGPDLDRIDSLFRSSGLMREKWERDTYRLPTIEKVLSTKTDYYSEVRSPRLILPNGHVSLATNTDQQTGEIAESPWQSLHDFVHSPVPKITPLVEGVFWAALTHWVYSTPGAGKTLFTLAALMHMAAGKPFLGRDVEQGAVLLIEEDSPDPILQDYINMISDIYGIELEGLPFYKNRVRGTRIRDTAGAEQIKALILQAPEIPRAVAFDACERLVPSDRFNSSELDGLAQLFQWNMSSGIANIMIDHTRKPGGSAEAVDPIDMLYGGRAKSAISDVMLYLSGVVKTKCMVKFAKFRGDAPSDFTLSFDGSIGFTLTNGSPHISGSEREVMQVLSNNRSGSYLTKTQIAAQANCSEKTVQRSLAKLMELGWIESFGTTSDKMFKPASNAPGMFS